MSEGLFITFEGGEGSGKTTQINRLAKALTDKDFKVITTREPGGSPEAETIRNLLVQRGKGNWPPLAEALMHSAARVIHVERVIRPALAENKIVICDRFTDSTYAYQGYGLGMKSEDIDALNKIAIGDLRPDLTFILDIDPKAGLMRTKRRDAAGTLSVEQLEDRYETMDLSFHEKVRTGFLEIAQKDPARCRLIDATQDLETIRDLIDDSVEGALESRGFIR